jgi:hygromycin-B 4-O-kinase
MSLTALPTPVRALRTFLEARLGAIGPLRPLHGGSWSRAYAFRVAEQELVVRFAAQFEDFQKDAIASDWSSSTLPIPQVVAYGACDLGDDARFFAISERARGRFFEELPAPRVVAALPSLFRALDALRTVTPPGSGFGGWDVEGRGGAASWEEALISVGTDDPRRRTHGWRERLEADPGLRDAFERAFAELRWLAPACPELRHVVHSDLTHRNVLVAVDAVTAVLDWGSSILGDPLYDIAWLHFWRPWHPSLETVDIRGAAVRHLSAIGFDLSAFDLRLRCYQIHIALDALAYCCWVGDLPTARRVARHVAPLLPPTRAGTAGGVAGGQG